MSEHRATIEWSRGGQDFVYETYSRKHALRFEGAITVPGNAAPANIPKTVPPAPARIACHHFCSNCLIKRLLNLG